MDDEKQDAIDSIIIALGHRFDDIPADLPSRMASLDIDKIDRLWEVTFDADSIDTVLSAVAG